MYRLTFGSLILLLLLPLPAIAAPAITCHCFTDRSYDPSRPALADPYFLATTQNSFFAELFSIDKKIIVMRKQAGGSSDDLWIAYWVATKSGLTAETLLGMRGKKVSWKEVIVPLRLSAKSTGNQFATDVASGASSVRLAQIIVDDALVRNRLIDVQELAALRKEWATNQEVVLSSLIAQKSKKSPIRICRDVKNGSKSWGGLLGESKILPSKIQEEFAALLK